MMDNLEPVRKLVEAVRRRKAAFDDCHALRNWAVGFEDWADVEEVRNSMNGEDAALAAVTSWLAAQEGKPTIICLCGSTRFKDAYAQVNRDLTLAGNIVLSCGVFGNADVEALSEETKHFLDELHKRKIDLADEILVLNVDGYIGSSTRSEIEYATTHGKTIRYLEEAHEQP